jgi:hypothetical protein
MTLFNSNFTPCEELLTEYMNYCNNTMLYTVEFDSPIKNDMIFTVDYAVFFWLISVCTKFIEQFIYNTIFISFYLSLFSLFFLCARFTEKYVNNTIVVIMFIGLTYLVFMDSWIYGFMDI